MLWEIYKNPIRYGYGHLGFSGANLLVLVGAYIELNLGLLS